MNRAIIILAFLTAYSCQKEKSYDPNLDAQIEKMMDSATKSVNDEKIFGDKSSYSNKTLTQNSPVQVLNARFVEKEYSTYKDVELKYKNVSNKTVSAVRFEWYGENSFGEPADMGVIDGEGGGFADDPLKPGKTDYGTWGVLSRDGKKIIGARAYEVVFEDGTKWKLHD